MVSISELLLSLLILTISASFINPCRGNNEAIICPKSEKQALLSFMKEQKNPSNAEQFSSWNNAVNSQVDCCTWEGVVCSNLTGHVTELHLQASFMNGKFGDSLANLRHLAYLDLSFNEFKGAIPDFIGLFVELEYLDLSNAGFSGTVPHALGNLSSLRTLVLAQNQFPNALDVDSFEWLSSLSRLEHLDMNDVNLSKATNLFQVMNTLSSLFELNLEYCSLGTVAPLDEVKFTSLASLDLSGNLFQSIPPWIFQLRNITYLRLSSNRLNGSIPSALGNLTSLNYLDLSQNEFYGEIPNEIGQLCNMQTLDLSFNKLSGNISNVFGNVSNCSVGTLENLILRFNTFFGHLTDQLGEFKSLQRLDLANNSIYGPIPKNLGNLLNLEYLGLGENKFTGNLPESMGQLRSLKEFYVDYNMLEGMVTESHFANLTELKSFVASGNHLTLNISANWIPSFEVDILKLGSWNLGANGQIPAWLHTQKSYIRYLDLSDTGIMSQVPNWFWKINFLNLSHNQFNGNIPDLSNGPEYGSQFIYLSSNLFTGSLPRVGVTLLELDLSNNLFTGGLSHFMCGASNETYRFQALHLGRNNLSGELPDCWTKWTSLTILNIGNNNISGRIPKSMGFLENLLFLDLFNNRLSGKIPSSLQNCTKLLKIDLSNNKLSGEIPTWLGLHFESLRILTLSSNKLGGQIPSSICRLTSLQILDLSNNLFSGKIPNCVDNFTAMTVRSTWIIDYESGELWNVLVGYNGFFTESASIGTKGGKYQYDTVLSLVTNIDLSRNSLSGDLPIQLTKLVELRSLNLSGNHFTGLIPNEIGNMAQLESLDFSRNSLSGEIPNSMATLTSLNYLNFSYNNLTGRIPQSTQLMSLPASGFIGNELCGPPLASNCTKNPGLTPEEEEEDGDVESEVEWIYVFVSSGYVVGLAIVCNILIFKKSWRNAYFESIDKTWNKVYVYASLKLQKHC